MDKGNDWPRACSRTARQKFIAETASKASRDKIRELNAREEDLDGRDETP